MLESMKQTTNKGPSHLFVIFSSGRDYLDLNDSSDNTKSDKHFHKCIELDPTYSVTWTLLEKAQVRLIDQAAVLAGEGKDN